MRRGDCNTEGLTNFISEDNPFKLIAKKIDLNYIYDYISEYYADGTIGDVDAICLFKLSVISLIFNVSDLSELNHDLKNHIVYIWFLGFNSKEDYITDEDFERVYADYDLPEAVYDEIYEEFIRQSIESGLVKELSYNFLNNTKEK